MKIRSLLATLPLLLVLSASTVSAAPVNGPGPGDNSKIATQKVANMTADRQLARVSEIKDRIQEIKSMDKSQLTSAQRKELKHEMRAMRKELKHMNPTYIYISGAGLVIIILLLIILL